MVECHFCHLDDKGHYTEDSALYRDPLLTSGTRLWGMGSTRGHSLHRIPFRCWSFPVFSAAFSCTCPTKCLQPDLCLLLTGLNWLRGIHDYFSFSKTNSFATFLFLLHRLDMEVALWGVGSAWEDGFKTDDCQKADSGTCDLKTT